MYVINRMFSNQEQANIFQRIFKQERSVGKWKCMCDDCHELAINSHLLQKHGILDNITEDGHMYELVPIPADILYSRLENSDGLIVNFKKVGINNAISWPLFCDKDDTRLFADIEKRILDCSNYRSQLLFSYRAVCGELRKTEIEYRTLERSLEECSYDNPLDIRKIKERIYGLGQTINDYTFYKKELEAELKLRNDRFIFRHYSYPVLKIYASTAFSYVVYDAQKETDSLPWECCFLHIIPQPNSTEFIIGYHQSRTNPYLEKYVTDWKGLTKSGLEEMLCDFCTIRAAGWGMSPSLYNKIGADKIKDYLLTFQYYGNCHDARCFCGKGIFEGELLDFV